MPDQNATPLEPNVYRDGRWLVVPLEGAVFPRRCVKTNQPVDAASFPFEADLLPLQIEVPQSAGEEAAEAAAGTLAGGVGQVALELINKRRLKFNIGMSDERQRRLRHRWRYGVGLAIAGPILGSVVGGGLAAAVGQSNETLAMTLVFLGAGMGTALMIVGLALFGMLSIPVLRVARSDGTYVWLEGAHPDFLATLPESPVKWTSPGLLANLFGGSKQQGDE